jgi:hypothetical protein
MAAAHFCPSGSSQVAVSWISARAQAQPCGRCATPPGPVTKSASAARATGVNCAPSADRISLAGTQSAAVRSNRTSAQCISTEECQSKLP